MVGPAKIAALVDNAESYAVEKYYIASATGLSTRKYRVVETIVCQKVKILFNISVECKNCVGR
jgi:hypothetical protein